MHNGISLNPFKMHAQPDVNLDHSGTVLMYLPLQTKFRNYEIMMRVKGFVLIPLTRYLVKVEN